MELVISIALLALGAALVVFAVIPSKFTMSKELRHLSERNKGVGIMHGMVRRADRKGVVADRRFSAPAPVVK
jgi:hypothetical protein